MDVQLAPPGPPDRGEHPALTTAEKAELAAMSQRIAEMETELQMARRAVKGLKEQTSPKGREGRPGG